MKASEDIMGMPITVEIPGANDRVLKAIFEHFRAVDRKFSTYKSDSEISRINHGEIFTNQYSDAMKEIFELAERTKKETNGYFDIRRPDGSIDPSGIVKG